MLLTSQEPLEPATPQEGSQSHVGLDSHLVHRQQKKGEMLSAGARAEVSVEQGSSGTCLLLCNWIHLLAFSHCALRNTVCVGTHYKLDRCRLCFSIP